MMATQILKFRRIQHITPTCFNTIQRRSYAIGENIVDHVKKKKAEERRLREENPSSVVQKEEEKSVGPVRLRKIRPTPVVDLGSTKRIQVKHIKKETQHSLILRHFLEEDPTKEGFIKAIDHWCDKNKTRHGHVDFIATALKFLGPYGLEKESDIYDKIMSVFPKDKFENKSLLDVIAPKPHPQIFLGLDVLTAMEDQKIMPSEEMHDICYTIFGRGSAALSKIYRMWFWFEEFKDINPFVLDPKIYLDRMLIIRAAIERILGNNDGTNIIEISTPKEDDETDMIDYDHFIVSAQTELHQRYISNICTNFTTIFIEGPTHIWINHKIELYFIMKTGQGDLLSSEELEVAPDEEREGVVVGLCFATKPYNETLLRWLIYMQEQNPVLREVRVIFDVTDYDTGEKLRELSSG